MKTRMTNQRFKILEYLKSVKTHPTAQQVYEALREEMPQMTLATVYRNLNLLAMQGEILRLEVNKEYHYDADVQKHQHCVCKRCGKIQDMFNRKVSEYALNHIEGGFVPDDVHIIFHGLCDKCSTMVTGD